jgi:biopolymer transport protein ExbB/TolQ
MTRAADRAILDLGRGLRALASIATTAPLAGFLGTVI